MMDEVYAVGVDGGGTKTLAVVVDAQGNERGRGMAGSANYTGVGVELAVQHMYSAVEEAARQAGCSLPVASAWFGVAGVDRPEDQNLLVPLLRPLARDIHLTNDGELVLSGLPDAVGIALIAGTGSIALGRDARGTVARAGGWGHIIGDEGSGYDLGRQCLQAVAKAADGRGQATMLLDLLLKHWRLDNASAMIGKVYNNDGDKGAIAALSALVFAAARDGDEVACVIVENAARELALATVAVKNGLDFASGQIALALGGGLLLHETAFRTKVIDAIGARIAIGDVAPVEEPALSAARASIPGRPQGSPWCICGRPENQAREKGKHMSNYTDGMTLEEQIGQTLMVGFPGMTATQEVIELIQRYHVGNIILFSRNVHDAEQVRSLTHQLQRAARGAGHTHPLLIAIDQENGIVQRMGEAATLFPGNMALGAIGSSDVAYDMALATGRELKALGINMNLAPVMDVNNNAANPVIGVRSFGEDPQLVARLGSVMAKGYQDAGVISCLKHFPGHGDTAVDSHLALPLIPHSLERLEAVELVPFRAGIEAGAASVMVAHTAFPALTHDDALPATLSSAIIQGLLREQMGYEGVIVSDCLEMRAISDTFGSEPAAVMALQAGLDLVLVSHIDTRQRGSFEAIKEAALTGELSAQVVQQAAERIMKLKARYLSWEVAAMDVDYAAHTRLQERAYELSTTLVRNEDALLPLRPQTAENIIIASPPRNTMTKVEDRYYSDTMLLDILRPYTSNARLQAVASKADYDKLLSSTSEKDIFIVATVNAHLDEAQANVVRFLIASKRRVIGIAVRNPYDIQAFPQLRTYLATYEYTRPALVAAMRVLFGEREARGHLPVSIFP